MSNDLRPAGKKQNNRKSGAAKDHKLRKRTEAEARQTAYAKLSLEQKLAKAGNKERAKLLKRVQK